MAQYKGRLSKPNPVSDGRLSGDREVSAPIYGCESGKLGWPSKSQAKRSQKRTRRAGGGTIAVYRCPLCPHWHVTKAVQRPV